MTILVTGAAGFVGFHLSMRLLDEGQEVVAVDNFNSYYDPELKTDRVRLLGEHENANNLQFRQVDVSDSEALSDVFELFQFDYVVHLAAQAGVRYSIDNPRAYINSNIVGFSNILECCRVSNIKHLVYASSSSVYGMNTNTPFATTDRADYPVSLYAATKRSNELMAFSYSHLFDLPATGLRFFTVYGPYGRPDMAYFKFTDAILNGNPIDVYNEGVMLRDFTYISDVIEGICRVIKSPPGRIDSAHSAATSRHSVYNLGNSSPVSLMDFIKAIEQACGKSAVLNLLPMQQGDVPQTYADMQAFVADFEFSPKVSIVQGMELFVDWFRTSRYIQKK
jgi:UDP-glucuronate 4-epimerase